MKKRVFVMGLVLALILILMVCGSGPKVGKDSSVDFQGWTWSIQKSPLTGRCYEFATRTAGYQGFAGMAEVPCEALINELK